MEQSLFFEFFTALLLGAFIGLERELPIKNSVGNDVEYFGGIRSYALISLIGAVSAWLDMNYSFGFFTISSLFIVSAFILVSYFYSSFKQNSIGLTSEYSGIITYFVGVLVMTGYIKFAVIFTILITLLLSSKEYINKLKSSMSKQELIHTLKFGVIAFIVLPLLPDEKYSFATLLNELGISGALDWTNSILKMKFFNPHSVWFFVVAMSSISYIGYILSKFFSKSSSVILSSIVGGMVSSTAVTATMSEQSKKDHNNYHIYVVGTMIANTIMLVRVIFIVLIFNIALINTIFIPAFLMFLGLLLPTIYFYIKSKALSSKKENSLVEGRLESPFSIIPALKFGLFVLFIKFISGLGILYESFFSYWGDKLIGVKNIAFYFLGIISGLADVDAITNDMATKSKDLEIELNLAVMVILLAVMSNNTVKGSIALRFGEKTFGKNVMYSFLISIFFGILGIIFINI